MQTFLVVSQNKSFIEDQIKKIKQRLSVSPFNTYEIFPNPSIGIEIVRDLQKNFIVKPLGEKNRLTVLYDMEKSTLEAQNALLKLLEEPPQNTYIILTSTSSETLLPTIVSRCQIITSKNIESSDESAVGKTTELLVKILNSSPGMRITISQEYAKTRTETLELLNSFITTLEYWLHYKNESLKMGVKEIATSLQKTMAAKKYVERNVNFKATLDILFLGFPKIS